MKKTKILTGLLITIFTSSVVYATGSIAGTVTNTSSNGVPYATVVAVKDGNSIAGDTAGDGNYSGQYTISGLAAGTYDLHVLANGYEFRIEKNIVVNNGQQTTKNVTNLASEGKITGKVTRSDQTTAIWDFPYNLAYSCSATPLSLISNIIQNTVLKNKILNFISKIFQSQ